MSRRLESSWVPQLDDLQSTNCVGGKVRRINSSSPANVEELTRLSIESDAQGDVEANKERVISARSALGAEEGEGEGEREEEGNQRLL